MGPSYRDDGRRNRPSHGRGDAATAVVALACLANAHPALADPCTVGVSFASAVPNTHDFAIEFDSTIDGVADLRWTMYAGDRAYVGRFAATAFTAKIQPSPRSIARWHSAPLYVRVPGDAPVVTDATVELIDPDTKSPIACSGGRIHLAADGVKHEDDASDPSVVSARAEERRALAGAATAPRASLEGTTVPSPACAKPFELPSVTKAFQAAYPPAAIAARATGKTFVLVEISPTDAVVGSFVVGTSGSHDLDVAARTAAEKSTYRAERFRCEPVSGAYLFQVDFTGR